MAAARQAATQLHLRSALRYQQGRRVFVLCSAINLPESAYPLYDALPPEVVEKGKLSQLQLEGVMYACTKHQELLPSGERALPRFRAGLQH